MPSLRMFIAVWMVVLVLTFVIALNTGKFYESVLTPNDYWESIKTIVK